MGLDDFASEDDFASKLEGLIDEAVVNDGSDEDIFDFPPLEVAGAPPERGRALEQPSAALPTETPAVGIDLDEDQDLFNLPEVRDPFVEDMVEEPATELETVHAESSNEFEGNFEDLMRQAEEERERETNVPANAVPGIASAPAAAPQIQYIAAPAPAVQGGASNPLASSKAVWVFVGVSTIFMLGLLVILWSFLSAFQNQTEQPPAQIQTVVAPSQPFPAAAQIVQKATRQIEPLADSRVEQESSFSRADRKPTKLEAPHETVLVVAKGAITEGRFIEARRMLFTLLAEVDRVPPDSRQVTEQEASLLIARSYKAEAMSLQESNQ
ncbi:MAG: hypothetical protein ACI8X5_003207 [Planctomycetota bacterium]|jgi:hypothetical protein